MTRAANITTLFLWWDEDERDASAARRGDRRRTVFAIGGVPSAAGALPGDLDLQTYVQIGGQEPAEYASDIVLQPDGKIVTGGGTGTQTDFVVVRQMPSGLLDSTFDGDGKVRTDFGGVQRIHGLVVQSNGRIVGAGTTGGSTGSGDFALARYRSDGSLDVSFGGDGFVTTDFGGNETGWDIALQQDGKLVVVGGSPGGASDFLLARYNPDGSLDDTFGDDGSVNDAFGATEHAFAVVVQSDGRIVAAGKRRVAELRARSLQLRWIIRRELRWRRRGTRRLRRGRAGDGSRDSK